MRAKRCKALLLILMLSSGRAAGVYHAADAVQISVRGTIEVEPCEIDVPESVALGDYPRSLLTVAGGNTATVPFAISLVNCPPSTRRATLVFSGTPWPDSAFATAIYANTASVPAADVGLQLINLDGKPLVNLGNGTGYVVEIDPASHRARLPVAARMYTPSGQVTAGDFVAVVTLNVMWQ